MFLPHWREDFNHTCAYSHNAKASTANRNKRRLMPRRWMYEVVGLELSNEREKGAEEGCLSWLCILCSADRGWFLGDEPLRSQITQLRVSIPLAKEQFFFRDLFCRRLKVISEACARTTIGPRSCLHCLILVQHFCWTVNQGVQNVFQ